MSTRIHHAFIPFVSAIAILGVRCPASDYAAPGPFKAGTKSVTVQRPNNSTFQALLYYPATATGPNTPVDPSGGPYAGITFGHGFFQPVDRYTSTLEHLATWGYLTIASTSEGGLFPSHANFAADMRHCLTYLETEHASPGSMLFGLVDLSAFGASGHSMGGGCSILATAADPRIKAVANLAAANTNPSAVAQMGGIKVPVNFIVGSADGIVPPANTLPFYNAGSAPELFMNIQGGWHCGFQDVSSIGCDSGPMPRAEQLKYTRATLTSFFNLYLQGEQPAWRNVWGPEQKADPKLTVTSNAGVTIENLPPSPSAFGGKSASILAKGTLAGGDAGVYQLQVEGEWPPSSPLSIPMILVPGSSATKSIDVDVPDGHTAASTVMIASLRSSMDGGTRAFVHVVVSRQCLGDFDASGTPDIDDFIAYQTAFALGDSNADVDNDGSLTIDDFIAFQTGYALGCE